MVPTPGRPSGVYTCHVQNLRYLSFAVISVSYHWNNYLWPLIVTNSPTNRTLTVGLAIFAKSKEANMQWANVCAAAFIIIVPLLLAFLVAQKQFMSSFVSARSRNKISWLNCNNNTH